MEKMRPVEAKLPVQGHTQLVMEKQGFRREQSSPELALHHTVSLTSPVYIVNKVSLRLYYNMIFET